MYCLRGIRELPASQVCGEEAVFGVLTPDEISGANPFLCLPTRVIKELSGSCPSKFESHDGFDLIQLACPERVSICLRPRLLVFVSENKALLSGVIDEIRQSGEAPEDLGRILCLFFDRLVNEDSEELEKIELEIEAVEDRLDHPERDYMPRILQVSRRLRELKQYYERLYEIFQAIEENENGLLSRGTLRSFRLLTRRADRLCGRVLNLREYVAQVRDAYQAQEDIQLNRLMKLFTVITAVFLPLTLIAGWYGMNFDMPEYHWAFGYPLVILLSIAIVVICILWFKRKKWF